MAPQIEIAGLNRQNINNVSWKSVGVLRPFQFAPIATYKPSEPMTPTLMPIQALVRWEKMCVCR
ncbi:MAG: hypothetical protein RLY20_832 [Verrucomicrobiota bacterium]